MDNKRRISFEVSDEQYCKLKDHLPYGLMSKVLAAVTEDMVVMLDEFGPAFIIAVLEKRITYRNIIERDYKC